MGICKLLRYNGLKILVPKHLWKSKIGPLQLILATIRYVPFFLGHPVYSASYLRHRKGWPVFLAMLLCIKETISGLSTFKMTLKWHNVHTQMFRMNHCNCWILRRISPPDRRPENCWQTGRFWVQWGLLCHWASNQLLQKTSKLLKTAVVILVHPSI